MKSLVTRPRESSRPPLPLIAFLTPRGPSIWIEGARHAVPRDDIEIEEAIAIRATAFDQRQKGSSCCNSVVFTVSDARAACSRSTGHRTARAGTGLDQGAARPDARPEPAPARDPVQPARAKQRLQAALGSLGRRWLQLHRRRETPASRRWRQLSKPRSCTSEVRGCPVASPAELS